MVIVVVNRFSLSSLQCDRALLRLLPLSLLQLPSLLLLLLSRLPLLSRRLLLLSRLRLLQLEPLERSWDLSFSLGDVELLREAAERW